MMASWVFRRAKPGDYSVILRLQRANFVGNLSEEERREGFLSAEFSLEQVAEMAQDLGTTIATVDGDLVAFLCAFRNEFNHGSPVIAKMLDTYAVIKFDGKSLSSYNSYIYGPVCIHRDYRRRGLLRGLFEAQKEDLAGQFDVGVAFVSRSNAHSLNAHIAGLGMTEVGDFELNGNVYVILVFRLPPQSLS
jgi:predicted GNAT superfamily acetyltransferase